tara:strand:- start:4623 stop:6419 length:1797 start_codon:yes stop_codon:yes gene_type:complete
MKLDLFTNNSSIFSLKKKWVCLLIIGISSLILRLIFFPYEIPFTLDNLDYFAYSVKVSQIGGLPQDWHISNNGWPILNSLLFSIMPNTEMMDYMFGQRILATIFSVITIIPLYYLFRKFFSEQIAILGTIIFSFEPHLIINSSAGGIYPIAIFLLTSSFSLFLSKRKFTIYLSFFTAAILSCFRYELIVIIIPLVIFYFLEFKNENKKYLKFISCIILFSTVILFVGILNYANTGQDGLISNFIYEQNFTKESLLENKDTGDTWIDDIEEFRVLNFLVKGFENSSMIFLLALFPILLFIVPYGIYRIFKGKKIENYFIIISGIVLFLPAFYAYGWEMRDARYIFILYPFFVLVSLYSINWIQEKFNPKIKYLIIFAIIVISIVFLFFETSNHQEEKESFEIAKILVNNAEGYNLYYPNGKYVKSALLLDSWPEILPNNENGHIVRDLIRIDDINYETVNEFIRNSENILDTESSRNKDDSEILWNSFKINEKLPSTSLRIGDKNFSSIDAFIHTNSTGKYLLNNIRYFSDGTHRETPPGLTHIIVNENENENEIFKKIYWQSEKYPYLEKIFDSKELEMSNGVKIFKINYKLFHNLEN